MTDEPLPPSSRSSLEDRLQKVASAQPAPRAFLLVVDGPGSGRLHLLGDDDRVVGRSDGADIQVQDQLVSQEHARISVRDGAYYLCDLGSRNGTMLNGRSITEHRIRSRDRISVGATTLIFLEEENPDSTRTLALQGQEGSPFQVPPSTLGSRAPDNLVDAHGSPVPQSALLDLVRRGISVARFIKRNAWALLPLPAIGLGLGIYSLRALPPPQTASAEVKLTHYQQANPVDRERGYSRTESATFFEEPGRNFLDRELVRKTLVRMNAEPTAEQTEQVLDGLKIEATGMAMTSGHYTMSFAQPTNPPPLVPTVDFLEQYLESYLVSEVDKSIRVLKSEASFLEKQLKEVEGELHDVEEELLTFRRSHIDSLPEQADAAIESKQALALRKAELELEVERYRIQTANTRSQLDQTDALVARRVEDLKPVQAQLEASRRKLGELKARGLTDDHPEVRQTAAEVSGLQRQVESKLSSGVTELERRANPEHIALTQELQHNRGGLRIAEKALDRVSQQLASASGKVARVPEVEATVVRLTRRQESLQGLRGQLFEQHRKTLVQIDLETANVRARYDIVSPAKLHSGMSKKFLVMRVGGGLAAGLALGLLIAGAMEIRRLMRQHPELLRPPQLT